MKFSCWPWLSRYVRVQAGFACFILRIRWFIDLFFWRYGFYDFTLSIRLFVAEFDFNKQSLALVCILSIYQKCRQSVCRLHTRTHTNTYTHKNNRKSYLLCNILNQNDFGCGCYVNSQLKCCQTKTTSIFIQNRLRNCVKSIYKVFFFIRFGFWVKWKKRRRRREKGNSQDHLVACPQTYWISIKQSPKLFKWLSIAIKTNSNNTNTCPFILAHQLVTSFLVVFVLPWICCYLFYISKQKYFLWYVFIYLHCTKETSTLQQQYQQQQ